MNRLLLLTFAAALGGSAALAETSGQKPISESDLLKQIETLGGNTDPAKPLPGSATPSDGKKVKTGTGKSKGPTEITALQATFDQKANQAVFLGSVVVKDPEFNVVCDKLTAHLKPADKKPAADSSDPKSLPTTPKPAAPKPEESGAKAKSGGGLQKAIAEAAEGNRVVITQDKKEADGTVTQGIGRARKATYDAVTGDIILTGRPEVQQGINLVVATEDGTVMKLNRDGKMEANGPTKTTITDPSKAGS